MDKPTFITDKIAVFDDVFDLDYAAELLSWAASTQFQPVHSPVVAKLWPHGSALIGTTLQVPVPPVLDRFHKLIDSVRDHEQVRAVVNEYEDVNLCPWVYPPGSGLSLHADEQSLLTMAGSYIYFAHPEWRPHWGGMLCVLDRETPSCTQLTSWLDDREEASRVLSPGHGTFIFPKPNRLVLMAPDALHFVTRVRGANRISIAGFFTSTPPLVRPEFDTSQIEWLEPD